LIVVVLPAPLGPSSPWMVPGATEMSTPRTASRCGAPTMGL